VDGGLNNVADRLEFRPVRQVHAPVLTKEIRALRTGLDGAMRDTPNLIANPADRRGGWVGDHPTLTRLRDKDVRADAAYPRDDLPVVRVEVREAGARQG